MSWTTLLAAVGMSFAMAPGASLASSPTMDLYIGCYTRGPSKGIYRVPFDVNTGAFGSPVLVAELSNPSFLARHPIRPVIYCISESGEGRVRAYTIVTDGSLAPLGDPQSSQGSGPCHVSVAADGRQAFVANYGSGHVAALPINVDGSLAPASLIVAHEGSGPNPQRQKGPHAHCMVPDPTGRFVLSADLGTDEVAVHAIEDGATRSPASVARSTPGAGPRMIAWNPAMPNEFYVANELDGTVSRGVIDLAEGNAAIVQTLSALPPDIGPTRHAMAHVEASRDGRFVYASVRDIGKDGPWHDGIAIFARDNTTGQLKPAGFMPTGRIPRHFAIDPTGRWLVVAEQDGDRLRAFRREEADGSLAEAGSIVAVGAPTCVLVPVTR